MSYAEESIKD